ncbi:ABC transporter permease, partial [Sutterella wadsworthensis]
IGHIGLSLYRLLTALALAIAVSFPLGVLLGHSKAADWLGAPVTFITLPLPKIVLLPVFFTILGLGDSSRILLIALATGYQILVIVRESALALNPSYELAMRSMGASTAERVLHVYIPAALPSLFMALKAASSTAVAVLFLAESFATDAGLGWYIMNAWGLGDMDGMFVGILGMCVLGVALYAGIGLLERLACPWALQK